MLVSVIIPVKDAKDTLVDTYISIATQDYQNIEIIFVDNGSRDGSYEIEMEIANQDQRVTVLQELKPGVNHARKRGFHHATGEYVYFMDADDIVAKDGLSSLVSCAFETGADLVEGKFESYRTLSELDQYLQETEEMDSKRNIQPIENFTMISPAMWAHLYKRELIQDEYFVDLNHYEDYFFNWYAKTDATIAVSIDKVVYYYNKIHGGGLSAIGNTIDGYTFLNEYGKFCNYYLEQGLLTAYEDDLSGLAISSLLSLKRQYEKMTKNDQKYSGATQRVLEFLYLLKTFQFMHHPYSNFYDFDLYQRVNLMEKGKSREN